MRFILPLCFSMLLITITCSDKQSEPLPIPEELFVNLYSDQLLVEEECRALGVDSTMKAHRVDSLYRIHHVTEDMVKATLEHYRKDLHEWKLLIVKVLKRLEAIQREREPQAKRSQ